VNLIASCWRKLTGPGAGGPLLLLFFTVGGPALGAVVLAASSDHWYRPLTELAPAPAVLSFLVAGALLAGLSLVPTHAVSLVAGMLFGRLGGSACALLAIAGAALFGFLVLRRLVGARGVQLLEGHPRAVAIHRALLARQGRLVWLVILIRLSPVVPFAATNLVLAAAGVGQREFLLGSTLGLAPRIVAVVIAGAGLVELDLSQATDMRAAVIGALATVAVLVLIGRVARRALRDVGVDGAGAPSSVTEP
jgi:uncharacterized membrane protein YdjX (TVP38/TMEM64 family)